MSLIIQKYGGTSVANPERINSVADRVKKYANDGHQVVVVVSAMSGETNKLLQLIKEVNKKPHPRESDVILSTGEQVTIGLTALAIQARGLKAKSYTGSQVKILTDSSHSKARIMSIGTENILKDLDDGNILVIAGFQGADEEGNITTLGRGGSDTTAVAIAAALNADECQIYTDVDGIYTTDPRVVPEARKLKSITFEEMLEMASQGSKVLQIRSVEFAGKYKVNLRVLSSFEEDGEGTIINYKEDHKMEDPIISGIAFNRDEAKITVKSIPDKPGIAYQILGPIAEHKIDIDMIIQNIGNDGFNDFTFTVNKPDLDKTLEILNGMKNHLGAKEIIGDPKIAKLSLVGVGMKSHVGVASKMFQTLSEKSINISTISTSEIKISILIEEKHLESAVQSLHKVFELDQPLGS